MQRERYIDIVKGLAILCIVLLHYENGLFPTKVNVFVGSFMITTFYVTAGWLMAMRKNALTTKELLHRRWQQLGLPYCYWTAIIIIFDVLLWGGGYYDTYYIARELYKSVTLRGIGTLWFLPALFFGELIWHWLCKKRTFVIWTILILMLTFTNAYHCIFDTHQEPLYRIVDAPFRVMTNALNACIGIAAGSYFYNFTNNKLAEWRLGKTLFVGVSLCLIAFLAANYLPSYLSFMWGCLAPLLGPLGFLCIAKAVQSSRWTDFFDYWGRNSLLLMVTHYSIVLVLFQWFTESVLSKSFSGWISLGCFIISIPIRYLLVPFFDKYAKYLLGK